MRNKKAFTLLELTVAMAVVGILTAAVIVPLSNTRTKKEVEVAARQVAASIREAQNYALTGKQVSGVEYPCNYKFEAKDEAKYRIFYDYHNSGSMDCNNSKDLYVSSLKNKVTFQSASLGTIIFPIPFGGNAQAKIILEKGSSKYTICVNSTGNIEEKIGDVACP